MTLTAASCHCPAVSGQRVVVADGRGFTMESAMIGRRGLLHGFTPTGFAAVWLDGLAECRETLIHPECLAPASGVRP